MEPQIDPEFNKLIPPLSPDEILNLEQSILAEGCRDALIIWNGIIIDGHNRYNICKKHDIPFQTKEMYFESRNDAKIWMINNQFGKRNLGIFERASLALKLEDFFKEKGKEAQGTRTDLTSVRNLTNAQSINSPVDTKKELAKIAGVSHDTIAKVKEIKRAIPDEVKEKFEKKISCGDLSINQAHKAIKSVKNDPNSSEIIKRGLEKVEEQPKISLENAVKEIKNEIDFAIKEKTKEQSLVDDIKPDTKKSVFNFTNDNIEWAKWTWNPVTGCKFGCPYCYARDIANRFNENGFEPTFYENRLDAPMNTSVPEEAAIDVGYKNVFVCSMADLFGPWVPDEWIEKVLKSIRENPQWNFLFLTKNPKRLIDIDFPDNAWVGTTVDKQERVEYAIDSFRHVKAKIKFLSCEPLEERLEFSDMSMFDWLIIGGRSKSSNMPEGQPKWEWVKELLIQADKNNLSVYFKPNLKVRPTEYPQKYNEN